MDIERILSHLSLEGPTVVDEWSADIEATLGDAFDSIPVVALDAEGVNLGRQGQITIVQLATPAQCFLLDVLHKEPSDPLIGWLRSVLEDPGVVKVIHDCRMDSDALLHHCGINLVNVHDTSCWHAAITGGRSKNLNDTLMHYDLSPNTIRNGSVYDRNPAFWATRPLTPQMIEWAAGDVAAMFTLQERQQARASHYATQHAVQKSEEFVSQPRRFEIGSVTVLNPGRFIGRGGETIRRLQDRTGTYIYSASQRSRNFLVYYDANNKDSFLSVQRAARQ